MILVPTEWCGLKNQQVKAVVNSTKNDYNNMCGSIVIKIRVCTIPFATLVVAVFFGPLAR